MLQVIDYLPPGFLEVAADKLYTIVDGPTLIHLPGRRPEPLFVSVLLHGNETTSWHAVQELLRKFQDRELPRALSLFLGNIEAARYGVRRLDQQPDFNRIWPTSENPATPEHIMMQQVLDEMRAKHVFASIDIHNNTGLNPHYACVNQLHNSFFQLATLFSRTVVYFTRPKGVQAMAFASLCPAVTVECGQVGQSYGEQHALEYLQACLQLQEFSSHPVTARDMDLFHTVAIVKIPEHVQFSFEEPADLVFERYIDHLNFRELNRGTRLATIDHQTQLPLQAWNNEGMNVASLYFEIQGDEVVTKRPVMPSMLTLDEKVIRQDCLCYLMERYDFPNTAAE